MTFVVQRFQLLLRFGIHGGHTHIWCQLLLSRSDNCGRYFGVVLVGLNLYVVFVGPFILALASSRFSGSLEIRCHRFWLRCVSWSDEEGKWYDIDNSDDRG